MKNAWNAGFTKETHTSVRKISRTMRKKKLDNFKKWRDFAKETGSIKSEYPPLTHSKELAELIGVILGDGHICAFPRTESLRIVGNSNNIGFAKRYAHIVEFVFGKKPHVAKRKNSNAINITIYEKHISKRLKLPVGSREGKTFAVPKWILREKVFILAYLRGLYEAEGSYSEHTPTYTYKFAFSNTNKSLLNNVTRLIKQLGFHSCMTIRSVQVSRKDEVQKLKNLLEFRRY